MAAAQKTDWNLVADKLAGALRDHNQQRFETEITNGPQYSSDRWSTIALLLSEDDYKFLKKSYPQSARSFRLKSFKTYCQYLIELRRESRELVMLACKTMESENRWDFKRRTTFDIRCDYLFSKLWLAGFLYVLHIPRAHSVCTSAMGDLQVLSAGFSHA